jgi:hypothetical protein
MASFMDFLKSIGGAVSNDLQQSHGGVGNFIEGLAGGVQDKFTGVTPQQREQIRLRQQAMEERQRQQEIEFEAQQKRDAETRRFREASLNDRDEDRALRAATAQDTKLYRNAQAEARAKENAERILQRQEELKDQNEFRTSLQEDAQAHRTQEREANEEFRQRQEAERAKAAANTFTPTVKYSDFMMNKLTQTPRPPEEVNKLYTEAIEAEERAWKLRRAQSESTARFGAGFSQHEQNEAVRDEEVQLATDAAQEPGADQNEIDEAEARKNKAIADYEATFGQGQTGAGFSTHESGDRQLFGATAGGGSAEPALIEQDVSDQGRQQDAQGEIAQFRELVLRVAEGNDGEAALQLGDMTSPENLRAFKLFGEEYGPEALNQLRLIYRQELGTDAPF